MAAVAIGVFALTSCGEAQQEEQYQIPTVEVITVSKTSADHNFSFPAVIKGKTDIEIRPQVSGFITKVHVDEGQVVRKGQPLFTIDQVQYQSAVNQANSSLAVAQTEVNQAKMTVDNKRRLRNKNIISEYEMQLAESDLKAAESMLASAKAQLTAAQHNLAYTVVTAPTNGVVGKIPMREGSLASPSNVEPLTTISDNSQIYAIFSLTEKDLLMITENGKASLNECLKVAPPVKLRLADGSEYPVEGKMTTISGLIDTSTGAASVRAIFDNPSAILRSGGTGHVLLPIHVASVIVIPQRASFELQDKRMIYVVGDSNKVSTRIIETVPLSGGQNFLVLNGLEPGEKVVVEGVNTKVGDGSIINPVSASDKTAEPAASEPAK